MIHNEIHRHYIEITDIEYNNAVRRAAYKEVDTEEEEKQIYEAQKLFVSQLRECMDEGKSLKSLIEYKDKIMSVLPLTENEAAYILVFYDKNVDNNQYTAMYDEEKDLFYIESEGKKTNE